MQAGMKLGGGGRIDVETRKDIRRVSMDVQLPGGDTGECGSVTLYLTISEARSLASSLMGASAEA